MSEWNALVIEDDEDLAVIFSSALGEAGFTTEIILSGDAAMQRLAETQPAMIVLDMQLPGISGIDILKHVREDERLAKTIVILATANPLMADMVRKQADLVLIKPVSFAQLRDLAARLKKRLV
jgi:CheY-like chemotaxis protein